MKQTPGKTVRLVIAALALVGLVGVLPVSYRELVMGTACPHLGPIPACHVVSLAYGTMLFSVIQQRFWNARVFLISWSPVFLLAAFGTGLELMGRGTCPQTGDGIPKCYFSFGLACLLILPIIYHSMQPRRSDPSGT